jgi:ubiquinone/menaquinone biosynthesis C-methylase UbiE
MFHPDKIKNIPQHFNVLEIGPGGYPHPRSNVLLEKVFDSDEMALAQRGYASVHKSSQKTIYYKGGQFPFRDKEFDYIICSHVMEHIPKEDLDLFISEMMRVGKQGFIEFPTVFYELINYQDVHLWFMNNRVGKMLFLDKSVFKSNYIHKIIREMFYGKDKYLAQAFTRYRDLFFHAFEWEGVIKYEVVSSYDQLINEEDYLKYQKYFSEFKAAPELITIFRCQATLIKRILKRVVRSLSSLKSSILR